jgi:ethanolamine ammonia-lyase large subunit
MDNLLTLLGVAGVNFVMGVPGSDDIMLNYQSTSFHDAAYIRQALDLRAAPEFEAWAQDFGIFGTDGKLASSMVDRSAELLSRSRLLEAS